MKGESGKLGQYIHLHLSCKHIIRNTIKCLKEIKILCIGRILDLLVKNPKIKPDNQKLTRNKFLIE